MSDVILVGGAGYIGSALQPELDKMKISYEVIDIGAYGNVDNPQDVESVDPTIFKGKVVVWLASFHTAPEDADGEWWMSYGKLMVGGPIDAALEMNYEAGGRLIYVSSMRALTHPTNLYGRMKARAENGLASDPGVRVLRFGTVYGIHDPATFRDETAVNHALYRGEFTGDHWSAFVTALPDAVEALACAIEDALEGRVLGEVLNVTDLESPLTADDLRRNLNGRFYETEKEDVENLRAQINPGAGRRAQDALAQLYGL